jgi:glycerophosphoryl diester phosphodiesterase
MPRMINRKDFSHFENRDYAHRGLHKEGNIAPENSILAFELAVKEGYGIELDVQLSMDDIPIVFHDFSLYRMCGLDKEVNELTFAELKNLRLSNSGESIPSLKEVLNLVKGQVPLIIEFKTQDNSTRLCEITSPILDNYKGIYCIESFNPYVLMWYKKNRPSIVRGQLSTKFLRKGFNENNKVLDFALQNLLFNFIVKPDFIAFNHRHKYMLSFKINHYLYKIPTIAYTIQSIEELEENKNNFDLFIFENFIPIKENG